MSAINDMNLKFTSGNRIPVDRTIVTRDEWLAIVAELEALRQERDGLRAFVALVAKQKPEKPDYWSACGQCESNISDAEDLIEAMAKEQGDGD